MKRKILEVCVDSLESALNAKKGGATRLELCANLVIGGTTPSPALFQAVQEETGLPVNVLIRPRFGDFLYTGAEHAVACREVECFAQLGANAVVIGALRPDGSLDKRQMADMISVADGIHVTLHRAFDVCSDPERTLEEAIELGVDTILTSGQRANCWAGRETIGKYMAQAGDRLQILIGGGVNPQVIRDFRALLPGANAFHLSGKEVLASGMTYRNGEVNMGLPGISEFQVWQTNADIIRFAKAALMEENHGA